MAAADYQYHNTMFLVAHFHYVLIPGVVFAVFAALYYWWPKIFGFILNERIGRWHFWLFNIGFNMTFMPMFFLGLKGMSRRMFTYQEGLGWEPLLMISFLGSLVLAAGFAAFCYNIYWSFRYASRDVSNDPWNGRTLEWATASPVQHYNFAKLPEVTSIDAYWQMKKEGKTGLQKEEIEEVHMPSNSGIPFYMGIVFTIVGLFLVFEWLIPALVASFMIFVGLIMRSFDYDDGYYVSVDEVTNTEQSWRGEL